MDKRVLAFDDNRILSAVFGLHDENLARLEQELGVMIASRGNRVAVEGSTDACVQAAAILNDLYQRARDGHLIDQGEVDGAIRMIPPSAETEESRPPARPAPKGPYKGQLKIQTRNRLVTPRSPTQADYIARLYDSELVFGVGPAGTGKTYLAVAMAVAKMLTGEVDRLVLSRPAVEAGENLGFLPGDLKEKVDPYLRPLYDALYDMLPAEQVEKRMASGQIEVAPLAYMRGRTLSNAYVILDEAQNTTPMQMKMFLTRFGEGSRMVVAGDPSQVDLPSGTVSGLTHALDILGGVPSCALVRFDESDVVRHPLVAHIVRAYGRGSDRADQRDFAASSYAEAYGDNR